MTAHTPRVSPPCPQCGRATRQTADGLWAKHRTRQDPTAPWCPRSGTATS